MAGFPAGVDLSEWQECRKTIGRLDTTLADLRKYGFSLVTLLITASGFLGEQRASVEHRGAAAVAIMVLVAVLFAIDRYYTLLLNGAVERALDLEGPTMSKHDLAKDKLTQVISVYAINSKAVYVIPLLYLAFVLVARLLASAIAANASAELSWSFWLCSAFIVIYFLYTEAQHKTGTFGTRRFK